MTTYDPVVVEEAENIMIAYVILYPFAAVPIIDGSLRHRVMGATGTGKSTVCVICVFTHP